MSASPTALFPVPWEIEEDSAEPYYFDPMHFPFPASPLQQTTIGLHSAVGLTAMLRELGVPVTLIEPRRLRAEFLERAIGELGLDGRVSVVAAKAEKVTGRFAVITARAVAPLDRLLRISTHLSTRNSVWVLPKGQSAQSELVEVKRSWHCDAKTVPSLTDPESRILLLRNVKPRGGR